MVIQTHSVIGLVKLNVYTMLSVQDLHLMQADIHPVCVCVCMRPLLKGMDCDKRTRSHVLNMMV